MACLPLSLLARTGCVPATKPPAFPAHSPPCADGRYHRHAKVYFLYSSIFGEKILLRRSRLVFAIYYHPRLLAPVTDAWHHSQLWIKEHYSSSLSHRQHLHVSNLWYSIVSRTKKALPFLALAPLTLPWFESSDAIACLGLKGHYSFLLYHSHIQKGIIFSSFCPAWIVPLVKDTRDFCCLIF